MAPNRPQTRSGSMSRFGSIASFRARSLLDRFTPVNGRAAPRSTRPSRAITRHGQLHSIASSARARNDAGAVKLSRRLRLECYRRNRFRPDRGCVRPPKSCSRRFSYEQSDAFENSWISKPTFSEALLPHTVVIRLRYGNRLQATEVVQVESIGLPGGNGRNRRDYRDAERERPDGERDVGRAGRRHSCEERRKHGGDSRPDILCDRHRAHTGPRLEELRVEARENGVVALVDYAPHKQR